MTLPNPSQSLWDFALAFYAQPQIAETCLQLQDTYDANVCLLIGLRWLDAREDYLDDADLSSLQAHVQEWTHEVVEPLRVLRRRLKLSFAHLAQDELQEQLRTAIKQAELSAEKKLLVEIESWVGHFAQKNSAHSEQNLARYLIQLNAPQNFIDTMQSI